MNTHLKKSIIILFIGLFIFCSSNSKEQLNYLNSIKKIDMHFHVISDAPYLREIMDELNMKFFTICTRGTNIDIMNFQINTAKEICKKYPRYYAWATTFDLTRRNDPDWADNVKRHLKDSFDYGALAVKVWKEIGMEIKNLDGKYIHLDDPIFEPIFNYIEQEGKTLIAHMGEPIQAWMPLPIGPDGKPTGYWANNPQWHFWDKPDKPSYNDIMAARDHVLADHPNLRFIGCHLGSLEFDVDEIAKRLDKYPNFAVGIDGRTRYFMWQARGKVREFIIKYQDRIMYGTDRSGGLITREGKETTPRDIESSIKSIMDRHEQFFQYYATDDEMPLGNYTVKGLALPEEVLNKIFYGNAVRWVPGVNNDF